MLTLGPGEILALFIYMKNRITPEKITILKHGQFFVFGSNMKGRHGAGAAKLALDKKWTEEGHWHGIYWNKHRTEHEISWGFEALSCGSWAIPTKGLNMDTLSIDFIKYFVDDFLNWNKKSNNVYLVTEIGCGLAGYTPEQIAPLFRDAVDVKNIHLPQRFWDVLNK